MTTELQTVTNALLSDITPKVASAGLSAAGTTPLSVFAIWLIEMIPTHSEPYHVVLPSIVAVAVGSIVASASAFVGGYLAPRSLPTPQQAQDIIDTHTAQQTRSVSI